MLYFAYGSNMSRGPMARRCPTAREIGRAVLRDYRFAIMANGYATVVPALGQDVHGLVWKIGPRDLAALDAYEDVSGGLYRRAMLPVVQDGATVKVLVYLGNETREGRPRPDYMAEVIAAARDCGLPQDYVATLARVGPRIKR
jgi:gamma-glutamylcyclotransferase (GGCT)/AIG2-like uncharacterized protein YtfP